MIGQHGETTALTEITAHDRDPLQDLVPNESLTLFLFQIYGSLNSQVGVENIAYCCPRHSPASYPPHQLRNRQNLAQGVFWGVLKTADAFVSALP